MSSNFSETHKHRTFKQTVYRLSLLASAVSLILSACQSPFGPKPTTETPAADLSPASSPTPGLADSGLEVVDNGQPLPPQVIQQIPQGGQELPPEGVVSLTFDQPMDSAKTTAALQINDSDGKPVAGEVSWPTTRTLDFAPNTPLQSGQLYYASLSTEATSDQGVALREPFEFQFNTMGELQVSLVFPSNDAQDVDSNAVITVIFNRPVVPLVIAEEKPDLPDPLAISPKLDGTGEWVNTSVYAFRPAGVLKGGTTYAVTVQSGLQDALGESKLAQDYTWKFSTAQPGINWFSLSNRQTNPKDYFEDVLLDDFFRIRFFQPMNTASTETALSLYSSNGERLPLTTVWDEENITLTITPTQRLALDASYTLRLDASAPAADGGALEEGLTWNFTTIPHPGIEFTRPANDSTQDSFAGEFYIQFASPMRLDTVKERIVVSPQPEGDINWWYNDWNWSMSAYFLEASTTYEIRFLPGMQDIYGNATTQERVVRFTTAPYQPSASLLMPYETPILRADGSPEGRTIYAGYTNVSSVKLELYSLSAEQFVSFANGSAHEYEYTPPESTLVWEARETSSGKRNQRVIKSFQPTASDGGPLATGFYFLGLDAAEVSFDRPYDDHRLLVVANANLTFKSSNTDGLLWLTGLESGEPLQSATVQVYDEKFHPIASGSTDADGLLHLDLPAPDDPNYTYRFAMVDDGQIFAFTSTQWGSGVSLYDYGIWNNYYAPANQPIAYVYTERPIYRPGQPVFFKGIVRLDDDLNYRLPEQNRVKIKISNYEETVYETELSLSSFGSFDGKLTLDQEAALGYYTLEVFLPGRDDVVGSVTFNVAEYRKPEFQVKVSASPANVLAGEDFNAQVQADYYSGGGVSGADVAWTLTSDPFYFTPPDEFSGYSFTNYEEEDFWRYEPEGQGSEVIAEGQGSTDAHGAFSQTLPAVLNDSKTSRQLTFEATITDLAQNAVSGRATVIAHLSAVYPGVKPKTYVGQAQEEQTFDIVALDWDGKPIANQALDVEIVERRWYSVQEQDATGRVTWTSTVEEIPVAHLEDLATDARGQASASFTPPKGGVYRARVTALDASGNPGKASAYMWVSSKDFIPWRQTDDRSFDLVADKRNYSPGDSAEILIASPFQGQAYALVTVERGHVRRQEVLLLANNSAIYKLPITADMAPNIYVSVLVVKGVDENTPRPNFKMGIVELKVDTSQQALAVELQADSPTASPGEEVLYTVRTRDLDGRPVSAEVSLSLSDLATLSLMPPNSPPILDYFYAERNLGVWTSVPIVLDLDEYNVDIEEQAQGLGMGSGGGKGEGDLGVIEVRQDFPDTAFWDAFVYTNQQGEASVAVRLPDNLTTWRMDARAVTKDTRVGQTTLDIISTKPLLVRPQTPRFFVANDHVRLGAAVHNNSDQPVTAEVTLQAEGLTLLSDASQSVDIPASGQVYVTWDAGVDVDAERVDLVFSAEGGGFKDASRPPVGTLDNQGIPVYRYEAPETVGTSGMMTENGTRLEAISLPENMPVYKGDLTIKVSPSLAASMTDGLTYLEHYTYECVEQTISRFLPNVLTTRALKEAGLSDPTLEANLQEQVATALQRLYNWQLADGGWGWWSRDKSDPLTSAYVVMGLIEARDAGYQVDESVLERGLDYLQTVVQPIVKMADPADLNRQAFILYVLARGGKADVSHTVQLFDQHRRLALYARAFLAHTLYMIDGSGARVETLLSDFNSAAILSASGAHWEEERPDRWNWNTDTRSTAIILTALSQIDPQNPLNANAVRWLMSNRTNGHWIGTQETAWSLMALTNWMVASGELKADYQYAVALNGERLGGADANAETLRESLELKVDVGQLLKDEANRLAFAREGNQGNLYYTAHLNLYLPVEETKALDQGIVVTRSYYRLQDLETPIDQAQQGDLLLARLTIVAPNALHYVVIDDPLPAGLEAVNQSLSTSPQSVEVPKSYSWEDVLWRGWGWWYFTHTQLRDEKVVLSVDYLPAGTYVYTYLVRAASVGVFHAIPTTAQEFYFPEVYGRGEGSLFTVKP
jgi:uncharacterized protein YfaS (alpha-2-macroglobulin family)